MVRYRVVDRHHPICQEQCPEDAHHFVKKFWDSRGLGACDGAILATKGQELVGFFRYYDYSNSWMYGAGTYVLSAYRSQGVAKRLWTAAIKEVQPIHIDVTATSAGAIKLLRSLEQRYTNISWHVHKYNKDE